MGKEAQPNTPSTQNPTTNFKLVGYNNFIRTNPKSDRFKVLRFHHVEFWCSDATNLSRRFSWGLGMPIIAKSDLSTGNSVHASYLLRSGNLNFLFTAPYSPTIAAVGTTGSASIPTFTHSACHSFTASHGLGVRAIAIEVEDADIAFSASVAHGAKPVSPPFNLGDRAVLAEVHLYGDVVLRYISYKITNSSSPNPCPDGISTGYVRGR